MKAFPEKLISSLDQRKSSNAFRNLSESISGVDFFSNDYLGFASSESIFAEIPKILKEFDLQKNGATGSRLLSGNHRLFEYTEAFLANFHKTEAALIFNSGYDANLGLFASVPQRGDIILFDELAHASIRDAVKLSNAKSFKFQHNDFGHLESLLLKYSASGTEIYIAVESVYSMDGDRAPLKEIAKLAENFKAWLIVDEAHATGIFGKKGQGLVEELGIQKNVFARINTFGKAIGAHGAVVLGNKTLRNYLINFARSLIYTTALPPHSVAIILAVYKKLEQQQPEIESLKSNVEFFRKEIAKNKLESSFIDSTSPIQSCLVPGNENAKNISNSLQEKGFQLKAILAPTVQAGKERIRFCIHSYNSEDEIQEVLQLLAKLLK